MPSELEFHQTVILKVNLFENCCLTVWIRSVGDIREYAPFKHNSFLKRQKEMGQAYV